MIQCKNCLEWRDEYYFKKTFIGGKYYYIRGKCKLCNVSIKDPIKYKNKIEALLKDLSRGGINISKEDKDILNQFKMRGVIDYVDCFILCNIYCKYFDVGDKDEESEPLKEIQRMWNKLSKYI